MKWMLAGVAALALAASGALAQPGNGNGNGGNGGNRGGNAQAAAPGNGQADHGNRGNDRQQQAANGNGNGNGNGNADRARPQQADRGNAGGNGNGNGQARRVENSVSEVRGAARNARDDVRRAGGAIDAGRNAVARDRDRDDRGEWRDAPLRYVRGNDRDRDGGLARYIGLLDGCPPGLAAKHNGCQPPGQARKTAWLTRDRYDLGWWGLPRYDRGLYRYDDGYLLRLGDGGRVTAYIPLLGGALAVGNRWPASYGYDRLDPYYANYYGLGPSYRYADNVVYRLDPETAAITSIAALLTGDDFVVGSRVPAGYDVYNVPYAYRDRYRDRDDAYYRYSDGYVYQVDPATRLVVAAIELLA